MELPYPIHTLPVQFSNRAGLRNGNHALLKPVQEVAIAVVEPPSKRPACVGGTLSITVTADSALDYTSFHE